MDTQERRYPRRAFCKTYGYVVEQKSVEDVWTVISVSNHSSKIKIGNTYASEVDSFDIGYWKETFDHLSSSEKNGELTQCCPSNGSFVNECPMNTCLAPQRLRVLEDFYKEVCRIQNEESGNMRVGLALSRAIAKVKNNE